MRMVVLTIAARYLLPLLVVFALFLLLRGHEQPGGGFAAALVLSAALGFYGIAGGAQALRDLLPWPRLIGAFGLVVALVAAAGPFIVGRALLEGIWLPFELRVAGGIELGTPILFDVAVCLVATGAAVEILTSLLEDD